ncbi:hypothetical protein [Micavibrio aeruginosavorus]|uniref:Uncharacterized protein n=1 Tax=Micavibrio aeruginosavorus (strain ARL-13) TaxID=856793 RepID=G2KPA0_MICAA|nr:hypothetical protein [Micavibrio aeruginosavorus]AEP09001.1 hypothetical protein MICA_667 [Micavibrio aeruginosavorus ARL-13]
MQLKTIWNKLVKVLDKGLDSWAEGFTHHAGGIKWPEVEVMEAMQKQGWKFECFATHGLASIGGGSVNKYIQTPEGRDLVGPNARESDVTRYHDTIAATRRELAQNKPVPKV